ncbi:hypothetical protein LCGC14_0910930 [marine sediment metagenome]|uniref:Uncharacterized protein n=1 Tax=marine sediment metagenome TaxID=412755 RepID=A0A0F9S0J4_9ZZZZ
MAKTELKDLGSKVCVDDQNEKLIPALGDGSAVPGDLCYIIPGTGKVGGSDVGAQEFFSGIMKESKITGTETAPLDGVPCTLVVPKAGHNYRIRCIAAGDTDEVGGGFTFSATPYKAETTDVTLDNAKGTIALEVLVGDTVVEVTWGR